MTDDRWGVLLHRLVQMFSAPLPGWQAQRQMAPAPRPTTDTPCDSDHDHRRAGVLVLLYPSGPLPSQPEDLSLVLTLRTGNVNSHPGQISLPGGELESGEEPVDAALREAQEELSVHASCLEVVGQLTPLYVPVSNYCIYPIVALAARRPEFCASADEVAAVLEVPLAHLLSPKTRAQETWILHGEPVLVPFFNLDGRQVWGATAMVLSELLSLIRAESEQG